MPPDSQPPQDPPGASRPRALGLAGLVIELLLPAALSAAALLVTARYLPFWNLRGRPGVWTFGVLMVLLSLVLSIWVDTRTLARRRRAGKAQLLNRAGPWWRLTKYALGGLAIPIGVVIAANRVELPGRQTPMAVAAEAIVRKAAVPREERLGSAVLGARESGVKVAGIAALQTSGSPGALDQLFRILAEDPAVQREGAESLALAKALASYGKRSTPRLLERFAAVGHGASPGLPAGHDAFDRYLAAGFDALRSEVGSRSLDPATRAEELARVQSAEAQARRSLDEVENVPLAARGGDGPASLVMRTFLEMSPADASDLLPFARRVAADASCADGVRGQALLLVARLGTKDDLELLDEALASPSAVLQARALQAISALQARLGPGN